MNANWTPDGEFHGGRSHTGQCASVMNGRQVIIIYELRILSNLFYEKANYGWRTHRVTSKLKKRCYARG